MNWLALIGAMALSGGSLAMGNQQNGTDPQGQSGEDATAGAQDNPTDPVTGDPEELFVDTIAMQIERYRRLTVPVRIGDTGPYNFMVDTGSQATVLSTELAEELQLFDREAATLVGMASTRAVETTMIPDFTLGQRTFTIRSAPIIEGRNIGAADGILGLDALQGQRVLLDFENGELLVADSSEAGGTSSYDIVVRARERLGQLIIHRAEIDGVRTAIIVDTGAAGSVGNLALQQRLRSRDALEDAVMTDVNGVRVSSETRVARRMNLGRVELNNIPISFADSPTFRVLDLADRPALILGMSELRLFDRVAIDFRTSRILFDIPGEGGYEQQWRFNQRATRLNRRDN
ncbi:retroviral-like aspartic protease family protein [Aurantiacibacter sp. D1-12]|uniref:retroviral-like aspartic protease family protein n=1 Tax=Aurantiacibacter sp. D1-12 TaxID=2993658 RepID=UPI00237CA25D|nr:retroviral-like aspartic protease family protein [Aurantiacibacter sp. D1-12]MDE1467635.1 retroviral-like aspartic protease family protein [Aurantiacibacter sp. D1-12]